jgi:hypothetical protein
LKKYTPAIPHGSKYRVYFNTPSGPLERVPAWSTYVQPGKQIPQLICCFSNIFTGSTESCLILLTKHRSTLWLMVILL